MGRGKVEITTKDKLMFLSLRGTVTSIFGPGSLLSQVVSGDRMNVPFGFGVRC